MREASKEWNLVSVRGQIFSVDGLFALIFCALFLIVFTIREDRGLETNVDLLKIQKINDLLITAQHLKINSVDLLEKNYKMLFPNNCGYIKIDSDYKEIKCHNFRKTKMLSNSIKYINNSNHNVYIEIGVQ